jgi:hypothetical protein
MRTLLSLACVAALGGCAIIVAPNDGDIRVHSAFSSNSVEGNGMPASDQRAVASLHALEVSGGMMVDVRVGPAPSLLVEADSNLLPLIRTEASGDTLRISSERALRSKNPIRVTYTVPSLTDLGASGSGMLTVSGLNGAPLAVRKSGSGATRVEGRVASLSVQSSGSGQLDASALHSASANLNLSGSGSMMVGQLRGDFANINVSGSGSMQAGGAVQSLTVRTSGSGSANLTGLASQQADLVSSGSGGITATVTQALIAKNGGSGGIRVYGNPAQRTVSGKSVQLLN